MFFFLFEPDLIELKCWLKYLIPWVTIQVESFFIDVVGPNKAQRTFLEISLWIWRYPYWDLRLWQRYRILTIHEQASSRMISDTATWNIQQAIWLSEAMNWNLCKPSIGLLKGRLSADACLGDNFEEVGSS